MATGRSAGRRRRRSRLSKRRCPLEGVSKPAITCRSVVFPPPDGPTIPHRLPRGTSREYSPEKAGYRTRQASRSSIGPPRSRIGEGEGDKNEQEAQSCSFLKSIGAQALAEKTGERAQLTSDDQRH